MMKIPKIIAFEGIDGSGKTTISKITAEKTGMLYIKTPDSQFNLIRNYFDEIHTDPRARLHFYIASLWDAYNKAIKSGNCKGVIFDRYIPSTTAYHTVLCGDPYDVKKIMEISSPPAADLTICMKTGVDTAQNRIKERASEKCDSILEKDLKFQHDVSVILEEMSDISILNENRGKEETAEECISFIIK